MRSRPGRKTRFALRRAALGVIRIVLDNGFKLPLAELLERYVSNATMTYRLFQKEEKEVWPKSEGRVKAANLLAFFHDRLKVHLKAENIRHDVIDAALSMQPTDDLTLVVARARALQKFLNTPDGENLIQGYKRSANILAQAEAKDGVEYRYGAGRQICRNRRGTRAVHCARNGEESNRPAIVEERFEDAMTQMAKLRAPIDAFFEAVQVNADNDIVRRNRLNLLHDIAETCGSVADLTRIEG